MNKVCYKCECEKNLTEFAKRTASSRIYRNICKECWNIYYRVYHKERPHLKGVASQRMRDWRAKPGNKEHSAKLFQAQNAKSPTHVLRAAIHNARMRANVTITRDDLLELFNRQNGKCAISGVTMTWARGRKLGTSISLDRIDSEKDYSIGNVRLICDAVNCFRGRMSDHEMLTMAKAIVAHMQPKARRLVVPQNLEVEYTAGALSLAA